MNIKTQLINLGSRLEKAIHSTPLFKHHEISDYDNKSSTSSIIENSLKWVTGRIEHEYDDSSGNVSLLNLLCFIPLLIFPFHIYIRWNDRLWGKSIPPIFDGGKWGWDEERFGISNAIVVLGLYTLIFLILFYIKSKMQRGADSRFQKDMAEAVKNVEIIENVANNAKLEIQHAARENLLVDSNIWMDEDYEWFFNLINDIEIGGIIVTIESEQFDEICNIKQFNKSKSKKSSRSSFGSRLALRRIESLSKLGLCRINKINIDANKQAYADPVLIRVFCKMVKESGVATLITNDRELRIRASQLAHTGYTNIKGKSKVVSMDEFFSIESRLPQATLRFLELDRQLK